MWPSQVSRLKLACSWWRKPLPKTAAKPRWLEEGSPLARKYQPTALFIRQYEQALRTAWPWDYRLQGAS